MNHKLSANGIVLWVPTLGHSIWILPLVVAERLAEGHVDQAGFAAAAWVMAVFIAVKLHVIQDFINNAKRRQKLLTWVLILVGAALLGFGLYRLGLERASSSQLPEIKSERDASTKTQQELTAVAEQLRAELRERAALERQLAETRRELQETQSQRDEAIKSRQSPPPPSAAADLTLDDHFGWSQTTDSTGTAFPSLIITGRNNSHAGIVLKNAILTSRITGETKQMVIDGWPDGKFLPKEANPVPPGAQIKLVADFDPPLKIKDFLEQWTRITFTVDYGDGASYSKNFDEKYITERLSSYPDGKAGPRVTKKKKD